MRISLEAVKWGFGGKAREYADDKEKTQTLLDDAMKKAQARKGSLEAIWEDLQLLFGIVSDWVKGRYRVIPFGSITVIIVGLLYFVIPLDLLPDFIVGGLVDDAAVLSLVIKQVDNDLQKYKVWRTTNYKDL